MKHRGGGKLSGGKKTRVVEGVTETGVLKEVKEPGRIAIF